MNNTLRSVILIVGAIILTGITVKLITSSKEDIAPTEETSALKGVRVQSIELKSNHAVIPFSGKVKSFNKIELYSEVSGILKNADFKEGITFTNGQPIINIDSKELNHSIKAQKSTLLTQIAAIMGDIKIDFPEQADMWEIFLSEIDMDNPLPDLPIIENHKFNIYISGKQVLSTYYTIRSQEERLNKYIISAPFDGVLSQVLVKQGTLIRAGQKIGEYVGTAIYDMETSFSLSDKKHIYIGNEVKVVSEDLNKTWGGTIYRINPSVDENSQMVTAYIKLTGSDLREGMILTGEITGEVFDSTALINRKLILNNSVYVIEYQHLIEKNIEVLFTNSNMAVVRGLDNGDKILMNSLKGLYSGMKVSILD